MDQTQKNAIGMKVIEETTRARKNYGPGGKPEKVYDGTGPSGYAGTSGSPRRPRQRQCVLLPIKEVPGALRRPGGGKDSRRTRRNQWVALEDLRRYA